MKCIKSKDIKLNIELLINFFEIRMWSLESPLKGYWIVLFVVKVLFWATTFSPTLTFHNLVAAINSSYETEIFWLQFTKFGDLYLKSFYVTLDPLFVGEGQQVQKHWQSYKFWHFFYKEIKKLFNLTIICLLHRGKNLVAFQ